MTDSTLSALRLTDEVRMANEGYPWDEWSLLRREAPVHWYEPPEDIAPFWSITRHADILTISKRPDVFVNSQRLRLATTTQDKQMREMRQALEAEWGPANGAPISFNDLDAPDHLRYRNLTSRRFTPRAMREMEGEMARLAEHYVGHFAAALVDSLSGREVFDLVYEFATKVPAAAIFEMIGVEESRRDEVFALFEHNTQLSLAEREARADEDLADSFFRPDGAGRKLLDELIADARARAATQPGPGLIDVLVSAEVEGEPLPDVAIISYLTLLIAGGLDTTRHATTGGVHALLEHPEQLAKLVADPSLLHSAVEEVLRWTSPVIHFLRTAVQDFELGGQRIRAGETVCLWYPSANRDEAAFERPELFDIARKPNDHLAFGGYGAHFCIGAHLARWELRAVFRELLGLLPELEVAGELVRMRNLHVGGYKGLPVRRVRRQVA